MKKLLVIVSALLFMSGVSVASGLIATDHNHDAESVTSHSGGTNAEGCHNDYKKGTYHCH